MSVQRNERLDLHMAASSATRLSADKQVALLILIFLILLTQTITYVLVCFNYSFNEIYTAMIHATVLLILF